MSVSRQRILHPSFPGGLLSPAQSGDELSASEEVLITNLAAGTGLNETPSGLVNGDGNGGGNVTYTLAKSPSPAASLTLYKNGQLQHAGGTDYSLSGNTITFNTAPLSGSTLRAWYFADTDT